MKKVITYGTYDLLHYGHIRLLERAKALGDYLIVGVTADGFDMARGKINVQQSLMERMEAVKATGIADEVIVEEYEGQKIDDILRYGVDIFADRERKLSLEVFKLTGLKELTEMDCRLVFVGNLDSDRGFTGDRSFDSDIRRCQAELDIIGEIYDLTDLDSAFRLEFIAGDRRSLADIGDRDLNTESAQSVLQLACSLQQLSLRLRAAPPCPFLQKAEGRMDISGAHGSCSAPDGQKGFIPAVIPVDRDIRKLLLGSCRLPGIRT